MANWLCTGSLVRIQYTTFLYFHVVLCLWIIGRIFLRFPMNLVVLALFVGVFSVSLHPQNDISWLCFKRRRQERTETFGEELCPGGCSKLPRAAWWYCLDLPFWFSSNGRKGATPILTAELLILLQASTGQHGVTSQVWQASKLSRHGMLVPGTFHCSALKELPPLEHHPITTQGFHLSDLKPGIPRVSRSMMCWY